MNPTIWIVNAAGHAYDKAVELIPSGELRPLTLGDVNPLRVDRLSKNIARGIVKFVKPDDYMLISGTPILNAITLSLWLIHHDSCNVLQWNAKQRLYELSTIENNNLVRLLDEELG